MFKLYRLCIDGYCWRDGLSIYITQHRSTVRTTEDEAPHAVPHYTIIPLQPRLAYPVACNGTTPDAAFLWVTYVQRSCVSCQTAEFEIRTHTLCLYVPADTESVRTMRLFNTVLNTCMLSHIAIGEMDVSEHFFGLLIHRPPHDVHNGCITEGSTTLYL